MVQHPDLMSISSFVKENSMFTLAIFCKMIMIGNENDGITFAVDYGDSYRTC